MAFACAAAVAGLLAALLAAAPAAAQTDVWTATLTPADFGSGLLGCNNASATSKCSTATVLSDDDFTYDSTDYSVTTLYLNATAFTLTVDTDITDATNALTVVVGSTSLAFADATQTARTRTWFNPGFSWTAGTAVSIRIPDTTPPELTSAAVAADGNSITVTFDESVDQTNLPAAGAFSVAADGAPVTVSGVSAGTAAQLVLALAAPGIRAGQVVTLGYTDPTDGDDTSAVQDTSGNDAVSFSDYSVTNNSIVVTVPSDWSLKPTGLAVGAKFRLLFLSSTKRDGSSSDIADYHAFIQTRAAAGHADIRTYSTGFRALGCTSDVDARDTTYTTYTSTDKGVPIYWLNGAKAADQYEDFYDGTWDDEANDKNESGTNGPNTSLEANYPLTGCNDRGTEYFDRFNRSSALAKIEVMVGRPNSSAAASHGPLSSNTALDVSNTVTRPMYGLSAIFQVAADTTPPTLTSADVEETNGLTIYLEFSEDLQLSNPPLASAFTLTVDGSAVTGFSVALPGSLLPQNAIWLRPPTAIRQGQAVVVTYTDPTAGNDTAAIQDTTGNDAADFTTGMNSVPAVINNSTVANAVLAGWSLTPTGLAVGDQFRLLFLSSTKRDATATDIATYNTFIQTRAAAGHADIQAYSAGFRALGCTSDGRGTMRGGGVDARDNTETTYISTAKGVPIYWLNGAKAADEYEDFYDGSWDDEANDKNESGTDAHDTSQTANWPWTGCNHNGTELRRFAGAVSRGLGTTVGIPNEVRYGRPDSSTVDHGPLNGLQNGPKAENRPLYGLSALFQVAAAVVVNNPATGAPTITGTAQVGQTLTAATTAIMDDDGLNNVSYTYQWIRTATGTGVDTNISGATASTYTLVAADLGTTIKVRVSFTDDASNAETLTSAATAAVSAVVPSNWTLKPTAVAAGAKFRLLFLSSTRRNASSTDIATYNTFIQTRAANGHADIRDYSAGFRAVGCTAAVDARDNTATTYTTSDKGVPIYWLNGAKAADQYEDFYDGSWDDEANDKNESGTNGLDTSLNENWPLTGCDHDGTAHAALGASQVTRGRPNSSGSGHGPLNGNDQITSGLTSPLYGLSAIFQVAAAVVVPNNPPTVATAIPDQSATAGTAFSYVFPANTFSDADTGDTLSYTATKTDATALPTWLAFTAGTRTFAGTPQAADAGTVAVKVTASDGNGGSVSDTFDITVAADTTPPTLTSVEVLASGNILQWRFSENLNVQPGNLPPFSAFTVTADGRALTTNTVVRIPGVVDGFLLQLSSPFILQGQTVVVTYTDPTAGDDANAIQDTAGNDAATFTTGMNGVPAVTNNSTVTNTPATGAPAITGTAQVGQTLTATVGDIADVDGLPDPFLTDANTSFQWIRVATDNSETDIGAMAGAYTLVADDQGTTIKVKVSFTGNNGFAETRTSAATAAVSAAATAPGAPTGLTATASGTTQIDLSWSAPASTGGSAITGYKIEVSPNGTSGWTDQVANTNSTATTYAHTGLAAGDTRHYRVSAINANGTGVPSNVANATTGATVPGAPTGLTATASGTTQIDLSWSAPASTGGSAITGYKIEVSPNGTSGWTDQVANTNSTATTYAHTGLAAGDTRHYRVSAINANGAGTASNVDSATTGTTVPGAPTGLTATASGTTQIDLSWSAPGSTGGSAITGYKIEVSPNGTSGWTNLVANTSNTTTTYAHTGLTAGDTRHYRVSAINANGTGVPSNVDSATTGTTVPGAPTGLTATASGTTQIDLSWSAPASTGGSAITGYKIEVSPNGTSGWTDQVANTNSTATTYAHTGLAAGDTRHYRVSAINTNGAGTASNVDSATTGTTVPGAPTGLTTTASGTTQIDLSWTAPASTGGSAITGYKIEVSPNGTSGWTDQVANTNSTATTYAHTGLAAGDTRHYRVSAINTNGAGTASNVDSATTGTTAPGAPTGLTATASGATQIDLSWTAPASTGGSAITGYKIESSSDGGSSWSDQVANTNSTATTYAHTGLGAGDTRHYRVSAINANGAGTASNVDSATTGTTVPGAPTGLTATASGTTAINLSWSAPASTGGSAITGYKIEVSANGTSGWTDQVANTGNANTTYAHTGLTAGTTRHYRVSAINANGAGTASNVDSATTATTVPGAPTGLTATASGTTAINLSWTAPGSTGGSAITGYRIEVSSNGGSSWTNLVANTSNTTTTYAHTGLTAGTTRHYRVSAINANGTGVPSNVANATTGATAPGAPTGLTATASGTTAINLSWTAPASTGGSAITGYKIESSSDGGSSWSDLVANTSNTTTTYAHTGLTAGTTRHYRVSAINTNGTGTASNVDSATTAQTTVTFGASSYTAAEGGATATVAVQLSAAASATVTIPLTKTHRGGATAADYSGVPSNVTFTAGQTRRTFTVTATDDADKDGGESVQLGFGTLPAGYAPGARRTATVTLVDDDAILIVNFGTERHTTVKVRESDTVWHRFTFSLSTSRDGPPNGNPQQPVTIPLVVTHRGGATPADYEVRGRRTLTSVTFGVGESVTSFSMRAIPDGKREPGEGLRLDFGPLPPGVRKGTWGPHETIEFVDQVLPGYTVLFGADAYTATEGGADAQVSIHLNEPVEIEPLDVRLLLEYGGGATDADHGRIDPVVTIPVGKQTATITVTATDDTDDDDGERVVLSFVNDPNDRVRVRTGPISTTVTLEDNDGRERVTVSFGAATYTATEGGSAATVRVALDAAPGRAVTVPLTTTDIGGATAEDYSGIPADVTFGADQTAMTFAVTATANDGISDGGESLSIGFGTLPEGVVAGSPTATTVTLADGTEQRLVVNFGSSLGHTVQAREGARRLRLNVLLDTSPRRPVTIPLVVTHVGGATAADYAAIPEIVTFAAGQTSAHYYARALPDEEDETGEGLRLDFGPLPPGVRKGTWGPYETIDFVDAGQAATLSVAGPVLTVGYPGALDRGSTPSPRDFVVLTAVPGGEAVIPVTAVAVDGDVVSLALARPVRPDDTVTLSYLADAMHPTRDAAGLPAPPLTDEPVRNVTGASDPQAKTRLPAAAPGGVGTGRLDLSSRNLTDVTALAGLTSLRELDLRHNAVTDLWPLAGLTGLQALYLSGNQIADLRPLAGLTGLQVLDLSGNQITDLWPLAELPGLRELDLRDNAVADLRPLESLRGLQALDLSGNQIADLSSLTYLAALERLNLVDNAVADLWPLAERPGLQVLLLDRNRITTVQALSSLAGLANLGLAENRIADLWPLAGLGRLHRLDLAGNAVADVSALGDVSGLVWLRLLGNPVSHALPLGRLAQLRWLWLDAGPAPPR